MHPMHVRCRQLVLRCGGLASCHEAFLAWVCDPPLHAEVLTSLGHRCVIAFPLLQRHSGVALGVMLSQNVEFRDTVSTQELRVCHAVCVIPDAFGWFSPSPPCMAAKLAEMAPLIPVGSMLKRWMISMLRNFPHHWAIQLLSPLHLTAELAFRATPLLSITSADHAWPSLFLETSDMSLRSPSGVCS